MDDCCSRKSETLGALAQGKQRRVLIVVMVLNAIMFVAEFGAGVVAQSSALMADSVDMFGDAVVYAISLYALSRGPRWEAGAALAKGGIILAFGVAIIAESILKIASGVTPSSALMLTFSGIALVVNLSCLALLWRFRKASVNMTSTFECSRNDVISNTGVFVAGALVAMTASSWPDIAVSLVIAALFLRSSLRVFSAALPIWRRERHETKVVVR